MKEPKSKSKFWLHKIETNGIINTNKEYHPKRRKRKNYSILLKNEK